MLTCKLVHSPEQQGRPCRGSGRTGWPRGALSFWLRLDLASCLPLIVAVVVAVLAAAQVAVTVVPGFVVVFVGKVVLGCKTNQTNNLRVTHIG